ncbi:AAA domain-containing protein [Bizionia arctica]|uniref:AAA+ ATPase domain-containing protein n=1 Tax=Bizionia arctica TaxID=1495645 RepID=A0A917LR31_9FLAO|nr:AAA domain-containing protein [Bizionia arctica]GGG51623.1 hypothetical protein GCM10010976_23490 [Bizionia arctica]
MNTIGEFLIIQNLKQFNKEINFWLAESSDGSNFEILTIKSETDKKQQVERILKNEIQYLTKKDIPGIQKIVQVDFDATQNHHYVVYEGCSNFEYSEDLSTKNLIQVLKGLDHLKKSNRFGYYITPDSLSHNFDEARLRFIGLYDIFKLYNLLDNQYLAPEVIDGHKPNFQSDIYSIFNLFKSIVEDCNNETIESIFTKALSKQRIERYRNYGEVIRLLEQTLKPIRNSNAIKIIVKDEYREPFKPILEEMNRSCFLKLDEQLSKDKREITGQFATENYGGRFFVNGQGYIFVLANKISSPHHTISENGFLSPYGFSFDPLQHINCFSFFKNNWQEANQLAKLNKTKSNNLKKWQALPKMEREFIEEKAFKAKYTKCNISKSNNTNLIFTLTKGFKNWEQIKTLKRNEVKLIIDDNEVGKIHDYNQGTDTLIIKDSNLTIDEIPKTGELIEDVRIETSQYKKQVEACEKFVNKDVINPNLCSILATPENVPEFNNIPLEYQDFENEVFNPYLKTDVTQREAVLEALHRKPIYLIQGPPGTGKTTVIVELIQQIIKRNSNAKILVTSQSNLAVDNVLERLLPTDILFMRLAASEDRISESIKEHSFYTKLSNWISNTQKQSDQYLDSQITTSKTDKALLKFYKSYLNVKTDKKRDFNDFQNLLKIQNRYVKSFFENTKNFKEANKIFDAQMHTKTSKLQSIKQEWFAFLNNAQTPADKNKKQSMINNGSEEVDLQTALLKSTNVIGATCIHIASGQYNDINFNFDYVIMDESSKATPAENLVPINMGQNIVLIGDHNQLPPVITRENAVKKKIKAELEDDGLDMEKEYGESLFEKLILEFEQNPNLQNNIKMLDIQYRMPRQLGNLISKNFYKEKLKNPNITILPNYDQDKNHGLKLSKPYTKFIDVVTKTEIEAPTSVIMISTSNAESPYDNDNKFKRSNNCNKDAIKQILTEINRQYPNNINAEEPKTIGVIAGYRGQVELLEKSIDVKKYKNFNTINPDGRKESLIDINTVDKFQGAERDIIIYDIVKSSKGKSNIGFLDDYRRINVAFSRAKKLLIIVGDSEYILKRATLSPKSKFEEFKLKNIVADLQQQGVIVNQLKDLL